MRHDSLAMDSRTIARICQIIHANHCTNPRTYAIIPLVEERQHDFCLPVKRPICGSRAVPRQSGKQTQVGRYAFKDVYPMTVEKTPRKSALDRWIGRRFGRLTVIAFAESNPSGYVWRCQCDCGRVTDVYARNLRGGRTLSCGCLKRETDGKHRITHGGSHHRAYHIWLGMLQRCQRRDDKAWDNYGGRGISVCDRWQSFELFFADMGEPPAGMSLDRIDNDGNYEPSNCRWATDVEQARNKRTNHRIEFAGTCLTLVEWSEKTGIKQLTILSRLRRGWSVKDALTVPVGSRHGGFAYAKRIRESEVQS